MMRTAFVVVAVTLGLCGVSETTTCGDTTFDAFGVCLPYLWTRGDNDYESVGLTRAAIARPETPLRTLALAHLFGTNTLPGLLNPATPQVTELSLLEQQVLRMMGQRTRCSTFPDDDRSGCPR